MWLMTCMFAHQINQNPAGIFDLCMAAKSDEENKKYRGSDWADPDYDALTRIMMKWTERKIEGMNGWADMRVLYRVDYVQLPDGTKGRVDSKLMPDWDHAGATQYGRIRLGETSIQEIMKEVKTLPTGNTRAECSWASRWVGLCDQIHDGKGNVWHIDGPIIDMTNPPKNTCELVDIYTTYRQQYFQSQRDNQDYRYMWANALTQHNLRKLQLGEPQVKVPVGHLFGAAAHK